MSGLTAKLPLNLDPEDGAYGLIKDYNTLIKQNLKNLVLTNPGERIMDLNFGVGIRRFLFENSSTKQLSDIRTRIYEQVAKYMPFLRIDEIEIAEEEENTSNFVHIKVHYTILPLDINDYLALTEKSNE